MRKRIFEGDESCSIRMLPHIKVRKILRYTYGRHKKKGLRYTDELQCDESISRGRLYAQRIDNKRTT